MGAGANGGRPHVRRPARYHEGGNSSFALRAPGSPVSKPFSVSKLRIATSHPRGLPHLAGNFAHDHNPFLPAPLDLAEARAGLGGQPG